MKELEGFRAEFEPRLAAFIETRVRALPEAAGSVAVRETVAQACAITLGGGKRLRPFVAHQAYMSFGGRDADIAYRLALVFELFHAFALVHDDIVDGGTMRHGKPTVHMYLMRRLGNHPRAEHLARMQAMLAGDLLLTWTHQALAEVGLPTPVAASIHATFTALAETAIIGEMLDVDLMGSEAPAFGHIERRTELKTAWYSFVYPILIGAQAAWGGDEANGFAVRFGVALGRAFQYQDDLMDIFGAPGKGVLQEVMNGQHTLLTWYVSECAAPSYAAELERMRDGTFTLESVRSLFTDSGAEAYLRSRIDALCSEAGSAVRACFVLEHERDPWLKIVAAVREREA